MTVAEESALTPKAEAPEDRIEPWWLRLVIALLSLQVISGFVLLCIGLIAVAALVSLFWSPLADWTVFSPIGMVGVAAYLIRSGLIGVQVEDCSARGWAVTFLQFFWRSAVAAVIFILMALLVGNRSVGPPTWSLVVLLATGSWAAGMLILTRSIFRDREHFGVDRRFGWRTARQEAGWMLLLGPLMEAVAPITLLISFR